MFQSTIPRLSNVCVFTMPSISLLRMESLGTLQKTLGVALTCHDYGHRTGRPLVHGIYLEEDLLDIRSAALLQGTQSDEWSRACNIEIVGANTQARRTGAARRIPKTTRTAGLEKIIKTIQDSQAKHEKNVAQKHESLQQQINANHQATQSSFSTLPQDVETTLGQAMQTI